VIRMSLAGSEAGVAHVRGVPRDQRRHRGLRAEMLQMWTRGVAFGCWTKRQARLGFDELRALLGSRESEGGRERRERERERERERGRERERMERKRREERVCVCVPYVLQARLEFGRKLRALMRFVEQAVALEARAAFRSGSRAKRQRIVCQQRPG
jgi:hypothetical protein